MFYMFSQVTLPSMSRSFSGYSASEFDKPSKMTLVRQQYWQVKDAVKRKIKGKNHEERDEITGSDPELASKIELFKSIHLTTAQLFRYSRIYVDKLNALQGFQNELGEFLRTAGSRDRTHAGKMFLCVGKSMIYSSELLSGVVQPLRRLQSEVEVFRRRAVMDTQVTMDWMDRFQKEYRAVLMWMKDASGELDPESYRQMENFRRIQSQVKRSKAKYDRKRRDTIEKVDILAASRCNMFGGPLQTYIDSLLVYWLKASGVHEKIAAGFQGYQYYDFSVIKELRDVTRELADRLPSQGVENQDLIDSACADMDQKLFFQEFHDELAAAAPPVQQPKPKVQPAIAPDIAASTPETELLASQVDEKPSGNGIEEDDLLDFQDFKSAPTAQELPPNDDALNERFAEVFGAFQQSPVHQGSSIDFWDAFLDQQPTEEPLSPTSPVSPGPVEQQGELLLQDTSSPILPAPLVAQEKPQGSSESAAVAAPPPPLPSKKANAEKLSWYKKFAELDPLENPNLMGEGSEKQSEGA